VILFLGFLRYSADNKKETSTYCMLRESQMAFIKTPHEFIHHHNAYYWVGSNAAAGGVATGFSPPAVHNLTVINPM
jgi:hypothetical protein